MRDVLNNQTDIFGNVVQISEPKPAPKKKPFKPKQVTVYYKFVCTTAYNVYTVYAQHKEQAFAKCFRMYGQKPISIKQEY